MVHGHARSRAREAPPGARLPVNTRRHTCGAEATLFGGVTGGNICGVQIEANFTGVRDTPANRERFADVTATVLQQYLSTHWGLSLSTTSAAGGHHQRFRAVLWSRRNAL